MKEIVFYQIPISHFCEKVRWSLDFKGLSYRSVCVNPFTRRELGEITKARQVPVIRDGERVISDSSEIVEYLDEHYPEPPLIPPKEPERREALEIERIADEELGPAVRRVAYEALFASPSQFQHAMLPRKGLTRLLNPLRRRVIPRLVKRHFGITADRLHADRRHLADLLREFSEKLDGRSHFVGDSLTIADISVVSLLGPLELVSDLAQASEHARVFSWMRELRTRHGRRSWGPQA